jgi:hypothetical protein
MIRSLRSAAPALLCLAGTVIACSDAALDAHVQRTDSAGVEIVTQTGADAPLDWTFRAAFTLGGKDTDEESFYQLGPDMIGVDAERRIYVLDTSSGRVIVFDADGHHLRTMGGKGGGPGEMGFPIALSVAPDGAVAVFDIAKRGFVRFGPDGEILEEQRVTAGLGNGAARFLGDGLVLPIHDIDPDRGVVRDGLVLVTGPDTTAFATTERAAGGVVALESCGMQIMGVGPVFQPTLRWSPFGSAIAVAATETYDIVVYRDGRPTRRLRRSVAPVPATAELAAARVGSGMKVVGPGGGVRTCDPQEVVEQRGVAEAIPVIAALAEGPGGTLWVRRAGAPGEAQPTDVFDAGGTYLGSLPPGAPFPSAVLGDRVIAVERDDTDVERLVVYEVSSRSS